jgi:predicted Zn-dependent protease
MGGKINNNKLQAYLDSVGQKIARVSHRPDLTYHFEALNHKTVNAFALPGGYVFITKGMLEKLDTESQLAGVLAHEITHIVARHASVAMSRQIGIEILLAAVTTDKTSASVLQVADVAEQIIGLRFSRQDEREADLAGMDYMVEAGYNPNGMLETMRMLENLQDTTPIDFLSSHPSPQDRQAYLAQRIQSKYADFAALKVGKEDYRRAVLDRLTK